MSLVIYGLQETQIILYEDDGITPKYRITLQKETKEGLELSFAAEGVSRGLGSGAKWARSWCQRGWRMTVSIRWDAGIESTAETWDGSAWVEARAVPTAQALSVIQTWGTRTPCRVSPHKDMNLDFLAQPDPSKPLRLRDVKGAAHTGLELVLVASDLLGNIPDWENLNSYFSSGYTEGVYGAYTP